MPRARKMEVAGQQYGEEAALDRAQEQVPAGPAVTQPPPMVGPDQVPNLNAPTNRPDEPVTAGMPFGPGVGPDPNLAAGDPVMDRLRVIYQAYPDPHIRRMIQQLGG